MDTINSDIFAEHQKMKESEDTVSPKELYLRESIISTGNQLLDTIQYLDSIKNDPDFQPRVFMLVGPQCIGKSWITKSLEEHGVNICSADKHMGPVYNFVDFKIAIISVLWMCIIVFKKVNIHV